MPAAAIPALTSIIGGSGGILSSLGIGNNPEEWRQNAGVDYLNNMGKGVTDSLQNMYNPYADAMRNAGASAMDQFGQIAYPQGNALFNRSEGNVAGIEDLFKQMQMSYTPNDKSNWYNDQSAEVGNQMTPYKNVAYSNFNNGTNPQIQQLLAQAGQGMAGGLGGQQSLLGAGQNILASGGQNPFSDSLLGLGDKLGQKDPYIEAGQQRGLDLVNREALLTPEQAANYGGELAQRGIRQAGEKVYRDASNRGGGPGSVVAAGNGNQMKADFADDAARANADARMQALMGQQGLNLQQMGQGANLLNAGNQTDTSRLGVAGNTYGQGGQLANQRLGIGGDLTGQGLQSQLGFGNLFNSGVGNQNQYALGMGNLANSMSQTQLGAFGQGFDQLLKNAGMNLDYVNAGTNRASSQANASNGALGAMTGAFNANMNPYLQIMGQFGDMARTGANFAGGYLNNMNSGMSNLMNPGNQQSGINYGGLASGGGGLLGGLGGLFK